MLLPRLHSDALLTDSGITAVNKGITDRMSDTVGSAFSMATKLGIAPTGAEQLARAIELYIDDHGQRPISSATLGSANILYLALLLQLVESQL